MSKIPNTTQTLSSSQCSSSQQSNAKKNIILSDGSMNFDDSWTCHIQNCTLRQRIIQCNTQKSSCMNNWSCQECIYGGTKLQCKICSNHCIPFKCFKQCYSYLCSNSLRALQCYYESEMCYASSQNSYSLQSISQNCKQCALDDQDVDACYFCVNACAQHSCWNNCSINSNFHLNIIINKNDNSTASNINSNPQTQILLTPNAIYGIMAMVGLICLIFGFWCGKNCSAHSLSKACCKWCVFWCNDEDKYSDDFEQESAWNWKSTHSQSNSKHNSQKITRKYKDGSMDLSRESLNDASGHAIVPAVANNKMPLNKAQGHNNNYQSTAQNRISRQLRIRFPMTPLSSRELPRQQNVEQSPDVRVAHFSTPNIDTNDISFDVPMDRMKSIGSDEEDAPDTKTKKKKKKKHNKSSHRIFLKRDDSFDGFSLEPDKDEEKGKENDDTKSTKSSSISHKIYAKDDMIVSSGGSNEDNDECNYNMINNKKLIPSQLHTKRVLSADTLLSQSQINKRMRKKQIIVLNSSKIKKQRVVSPPPIKSKSEFQMLLRPTMSADAIALKKKNQK